jgi:heme-degrading monooxygenase HmoA
MLATATQMKIEGVKGLFLFFVHLYRVKKQLDGCPGLVSLALNPRFQTLSVWESEAAMKAFRNSGAHLAAMKATRKMGRAKVVTWETAEVPSWREARQRLADG